MATATPPTPGATTATADPSDTPQLSAVPPPGRKQPFWDRVQAFRQKHAKAEIVVFFASGFIFDLVTLDRIDSVLTLVQQFVYLSILGGLLLLEQRHALGLWKPGSFMGRAWRLHEDVMHFLFGSLLSSYTLFYFKSASGLSAIGFMLALVGLLLINELPRFRKLGPLMRFALFSLCLSSYLAYVIPVLAGFVRWYLFLAAILMASGITAWLYRKVEKWGAQNPNAVAPPSAHFPAISPNVRGKRLLIVALGVQVTFFVLYMVRAIPPVPLSVSYIGVYHDVKRAPDHSGYLLEHEKPTWKFWHRGDQSFKARPGDKIFVFARVFAPRRFSDKIFAVWSHKDPKRGWVPERPIRLNITGGRDDGFATYANKANWQPGDYKCELQTEDERDIGEIHLTVETDSGTEPRVFVVDKR